LEYCSGWALCSPAKCWAISSVGLKSGFPNRKGDFSSSSTCVTVNVPCAVFVICDSERQANQLFALKRMKGRFGRQEYRFICPTTARQSTAISYSNGRFFCSI
jgi:hypothetical protein